MNLNVMLYGAALSALLAAILVTLPFRPRRISTVLTAATSAFLGPVSWNWVLRNRGVLARHPGSAHADQLAGRRLCRHHPRPRRGSPWARPAQRQRPKK